MGLKKNFRSPGGKEPIATGFYFGDGFYAGNFALESSRGPLEIRLHETSSPGPSGEAK